MYLLVYLFTYLFVYLFACESECFEEEESFFADLRFEARTVLLVP